MKTAAVLTLVLLAASVAGAQSAGDRAWDAAMVQYKADQLDSALKLFEAFRVDFPDDPKADDALWFIGRIYVKVGKPTEAEGAFQQLLKLPFRSNRYTEATYDLARVRVSQGMTEDAIALLESVKRTKSLSSEDRRVLRLLAELEADRAGAWRRAYRDADAAAGWQRAIAIYDQLVAEPADDQNLGDDLAALGSVWEDVAAAAPDRASHEAARAMTLDALGRSLPLAAGTPHEARLRAQVARVERGETARLSGTVEAFGGAAPVSVPASSYTQWGALASMDLALVLPVGWNQELLFGLSAGWDSFSLTTSNFTAAEAAAGAVRIVQQTGDLGASLAWHAGSRHGLHSELDVGASWSPAEDLGNTSYGLSADERLDWRLAPAWKLGLDLGVGWEAWPDDLLAMTKQLDRWEASLNPKATWYPAPDLAVDAGYQFTFRQYLDAVYAPDTLSKQYLVHEADVGLRWTPGSVVRLSLDYALTYNDSRRYTVTVFGPGAVVVPDYYDYVEHAVDLKADLRWSTDLRTVVRAGASRQGFTSYPARDATKTFTGATRTDWHVNADAEAAWRFWPRTANGFADLWAVASASWQTNVSNNSWEDTIQTNYTKVEAYAGVRATLP
jgi:hypothetical protein